MAAINNCTAIMTDPHGRYRFTPHDTLAAFRNLTLYTNAESCPMVCHPTHPPSSCVYTELIQTKPTIVCFCH